MKNPDLKSMSVDQLWSLYEELVVELSHQLKAEKATLEERQQKLRFAANAAKSFRGRSSPSTKIPKIRRKPGRAGENNRDG
jgi:hypothetical protein